MNNLIKSEWFLFRKNGLVTSVFCLVTVFFFVFTGGFSDDKEWSFFSYQALGNGSIVAVLMTGMITGACISVTYLNRIQLYEIMAGFKPSQIILGRTAFYVPLLTVSCLVPVSAVLLIFDHSIEMIQTLALFWLLFIRFQLCTVFLSPFFKEGSWITGMTALVILVKSLYEDMFDSSAKFKGSVFGLTTLGQCSFLGGEITSGYAVRIIISSVVSCVICYLIGYMTLKKKYDLEPHQLI